MAARWVFDMSLRPGGRRSLHALLAGLLGGVAALVAIALAGVYIYQENLAAMDRSTWEVESTARSTAALVNSQVSQHLEALSMLAVTPGLVADLEAGRVDSLNDQLEAFGAASSEFSRLALTDRTGRLVANSASGDKASLGADFSQQPHIAAALKASQSSVGTPRAPLGRRSAARVGRRSSRSASQSLARTVSQSASCRARLPCSG
jgi:hypothetical protein